MFLYFGARHGALNLHPKEIYHDQRSLTRNLAEGKWYRKGRVYRNFLLCFAKLLFPITPDAVNAAVNCPGPQSSLPMSFLQNRLILLYRRRCAPRLECSLTGRVRCTVCQDRICSTVPTRTLQSRFCEDCGQCTTTVACLRQRAIVEVDGHLYKEVSLYRPSWPIRDGKHAELFQ
ncbi:uncharacterized protein BT62DRAFT_931485, partial [Guyanagaster necrorhizus]